MSQIIVTSPTGCEREQAALLYDTLQKLRVIFSDYVPLWEALGDCSEVVAKRHRQLVIKEKKSLDEVRNESLDV